MSYRQLKEIKLYNDLTPPGYSRAAEVTFFFIPELKIALDIGGMNKTIHSQYFFISHTHSDHCIHLPEAQPAFKDTKNPTMVICPLESLSFIDNYICTHLNN